MAPQEPGFRRKPRYLRRHSSKCAHMHGNIPLHLPTVLACLAGNLSDAMHIAMHPWRHTAADVKHPHLARCARQARSQPPRAACPRAMQPQSASMSGARTPIAWRREHMPSVTTDGCKQQHGLCRKLRWWTTTTTSAATDSSSAHANNAWMTDDQMLGQRTEHAPW